MDWNDIRLIVEIARTGSFRGAAEAFGVSKPTISRRVSNIERRADARLFARTPHGAVITDAGKKLLTRALEIDEAVHAYEGLVRTLGKSSRPPVAARMTDGVATYLITPAMTQQNLGPLGMAAVRSGIKLPTMRLVRGESPEPADLRFVWTQHGEVPSSTVASNSDRTTKLADIRFVPFASMDYRRRVDVASFQDLRGHQLLSMPAYRWFSTDGWTDWHGLLEAREESEPIEADSSASLAFLVGGGAGVGLLPTYSPACMDRLRAVDVPVPRMIGSLWLCCSEDGARDAAVSQTFSTLRKLFRHADWMSKSARA